MSKTEAGKASQAALYLRQVTSELRKVVWPTRDQLLRYSIVVLVFLLVVGAYIALVDFLSARGALIFFGVAALNLNDVLSPLQAVHDITQVFLP